MAYLNPFHFNRRTIASQCCVSSTVWESAIGIHIFTSLSLLPTPTSYPLGCHRSPSWTLCPISWWMAEVGWLGIWGWLAQSHLSFFYLREKWTGIWEENGWVKVQYLAMARANFSIIFMHPEACPIRVFPPRGQGLLLLALSYTNCSSRHRVQSSLWVGLWLLSQARNCSPVSRCLAFCQ